jgi:hypothetical protein
MASLFAQLMTNVLGYKHYMAQGGDWGGAMMDSPVGVAAWILEKFNSWSDTDGDNVESVHSKDELLTDIRVY